MPVHPSPLDTDPSAHVATTAPSAPTRPGEWRTTGFGSTVFGGLGAVDASPAVAASVFDACHVGVVLRALLFVHGVLGVGVLFGAASFQGWLLQFTAASSAGLPAVLLWLLVACAGKRLFGALPLAGQWGVAIGLGAVSGVVGAALAAAAAGGVLGGPAWLAPALAGAGMAAAMLQWLRLRAQAALPAETTARLAELQSRIRPHFLFNTLNTALALVRIDPLRAERVLEDLAELFRVAIAESAESVTLGEEVELAQRYLAIEKIRFGDRLVVHWELEPAAGSARVPPLLLQPLVENAVRHGIEPAADGGVIRVRTRIRHGRVLVSIVNSVPDAPARPGNGIALRNVRERLRLMHDVAAQFESRLEDGVFRVQIVVPL